MIAYVLEGASPLTATEDPRACRLMSSGPWMAQPHPQGAMLVWKTEGVSRVDSFGEPRKTADGMVYLPPRTLPALGTLLAPAMRQREVATDIAIVREEELLKVRIVPAYASPRKILDDNTVGGFSTRYGRAVRSLLDTVTKSPDASFDTYSAELFEVCRLAIMHTYPRMTRELITDYCILDEDTVYQIWEGTIHVPKDLSAPGSASSATQSPTAA
jgi:hypothetical protein